MSSCIYSILLYTFYETNFFPFDFYFFLAPGGKKKLEKRRVRSGIISLTPIMRCLLKATVPVRKFSTEDTYTFLVL